MQNMQFNSICNKICKKICSNMQVFLILMYIAKNMQNMQNNMQNMQNMWNRFQYAEYALPTLLMDSVIREVIEICTGQSGYTSNASLTCTGRLTPLKFWSNYSILASIYQWQQGPAGGGQSVITEPVWANQGFSSFMDFLRLPSRSPHCADTSQIHCLK